jgi:hypothetical protein
MSDSGMRRTKSDPTAWKKLWKADAETLTCAPRWTAPKCAKHTSTQEKWHSYLNNTRYSLGGGYRDTWVQVAVRKNRTPGPGHYETNTELPYPVEKKNSKGDSDYCLKALDSGEFNVNNTRKERAPKYTTLGRREAREVGLTKTKLSCLKASYLNTPSGSKTTDVMETPGPGTYNAYTSFGAASGGHQHPRHRPLFF